MRRKHRRRIFKVQIPAEQVQPIDPYTGRPLMSSQQWTPFQQLVVDPRVKVHYSSNVAVTAKLVRMKLRNVPRHSVIVLSDCVIEVVA